MRSESNPLGMQGIDFVEWGTPNPGTMHEIFQSFGFSRLHEHGTKNISAYTQHDITFFLNSPRTKRKIQLLIFLSRPFTTTTTVASATAKTSSP